MCKMKYVNLYRKVDGIWIYLNLPYDKMENTVHDIDRQMSQIVNHEEIMRKIKNDEKK